jgi:glyoxylase-like metal-dependent hydrolase (beta-lactamase superfamily II)
MKIQFQNENITVFESALYRTTATVIALTEAVIIVDPNWLPIEVEFIAQFVHTNYKDHEQYLLFTHSDYDHIIGYGKFPNAKVIASEKLVTNPDKDAIIKQITDFDNEYYIKRNYLISYPTVDFTILYNGQILHINGVDFIFYHAPGHVRDGLFTLIPALDCWIVGDYLSNVENPMVDDNLEDYIQTLQQAENLVNQYPSIHLSITGHGDIAKSRTEILKRIATDLEYLHTLK